MPQLGEVTAKIALNSQGIQIRVDASHSETVNLLKKNELSLAKDMQSVGLNIVSMEVQQDDRK
nr:flagellar hook-length control protein FliK [Nitrosomonas sp. JL21]